MVTNLGCFTYNAINNNLKYFQMESEVKDDFKIHEFSQVKEEVYELKPDSKHLNCDFCQFFCSDENTLYCHILENHSTELDIKDEPRVPQLYKCSYCKHSTNDKSNLKRHIISKHPDNEEYVVNMKIRKCPHCDFSTKWGSNMLKHVRAKHRTGDKQEEEKLKECEHCDFTSKWSFGIYSS